MTGFIHEPLITEQETPKPPPSPVPPVKPGYVYDLEQARYLLSRGWAQGAFKRPGYPAQYCALGAIRAAGGDREAYDALRRALPPRRIWRPWKRSIAWFNDTRKNKREVLAVFDRAIEGWK